MRGRAEFRHAMASTLNAALGAVAAMLFWTCLGASITRRLAPRSLVLPMAPVVGWAAHSAAALPIFRVVGFSQPSVLITAALSVIASALVLRARPSPDEAGSGEVGRARVGEEGRVR